MRQMSVDSSSIIKVFFKINSHFKIFHDDSAFDAKNKEQHKDKAK